MFRIKGFLQSHQLAHRNCTFRGRRRYLFFQTLFQPTTINSVILRAPCFTVSRSLPTGDWILVYICLLLRDPSNGTGTWNQDCKWKALSPESAAPSSASSHIHTRRWCSKVVSAPHWPAYYWISRKLIKRKENSMSIRYSAWGKRKEWGDVASGHPILWDLNKIGLRPWSASCGICLAFPKMSAKYQTLTFSWSYLAPNSFSCWALDLGSLDLQLISC